MITALLLAALLEDPSGTPASARAVEVRQELASHPPRAFAPRVDVAREMIGAGLVREAVAELDRILRLVPDERHVLALLEDPSVFARITSAWPVQTTRESGETARGALLREGARLSTHGASPTKRELVVRALAAAELTRLAFASAGAQPAGTGTATGATTPPSLTPTGRTGTDGTAGAAEAADLASARAAERTLLEDLIRELESGATTRRAFACLALRRLARGRALGPLAVHAVLDPALDVRDEAIAALREARDPAVTGAVVRALAAQSGRVRSRAAEALGRMGYREAVDPLIAMLAAAAPAPSGAGGGGPVRANLYSGLSTAYVKDYDLEIAQGASVANPIVEALTTGVVFDVGVAGTSAVPVAIEAFDASLALTRLTGQRFGTNAGQWQAWWAAHRDEYVPASRRTPRTGGD